MYKQNFYGLNGIHPTVFNLSFSLSLCTVQHNIAFIPLISMLHVLINVSHHRVFSTNPQNQAEMLLFWR